MTAPKQAAREVRTPVELLVLLNEIALAMARRQDLASIFQVVVGSLEDRLALSLCCVCLVDRPSSVLRVACLGSGSRALGQALSMSEQAALEVDANGLSRCLEGELVYESDAGQAAFPFMQRLARAGLRCVVLAPLGSPIGGGSGGSGGSGGIGGIGGVLVAARRERDAFTDAERAFLRQLSEHVGLAAHRSQIHGALQQAYDDLRQTQQAVAPRERSGELGQMASGVAHDITNAIAPLALYRELLLETEPGLSERARGYLEGIQRAAADVAQIVTRLRESHGQDEDPDQV